jgi:phosphoribosyl 1,2-cyclic phosphodiesterase
LVVHIGNNEWIIIDSCKQAGLEKPVPIEYLESLGVNPSNDVKLFVITHWHSDHIRGSAEVAKQCSSATICFAESLMKEEFFTLVDLFSGLSHPVLFDKETCATKEMASIIKTIKQRCENSDFKYTPYLLASADKRIYRCGDINLTSEIWALSPSSETLVESLREIANLISPSEKSELRRVIPKPTQNHNSIVLQLKFSNNLNLLLGADLEETKNPLTGWSCIVSSQNRPSGKSKIFKIPHHGSFNGHSDDVWQNMIDNNAVGILTSKLGGKGSPPKDGDLNRIKKYTPNVYLTSVPVSKKHKRNPTVEKTMKGVVTNRYALNGNIGQIQIRIENSNMQVNLKNPARKL